MYNSGGPIDFGPSLVLCLDRIGPSSFRRGSGSVGFARGFSLPGRAARLAAIGGRLGTEEDKWFGVGPEATSGGGFPDIPEPSCPDDWLAQYAEPGQTFSAFLRQNPWTGSRKVARYAGPFLPDRPTLPERYPGGRVYLVQIGEFNLLAPALRELSEFASTYLGLPVVLLGKIGVTETETSIFMKIPAHLSPDNKKSATTTTHELPCRRESGRVQLQCPFLLRQLNRLIPSADGLCLIGLTMYDLYEATPDLFVAGLAAGARRTAVFSFRRYDPQIAFSAEFWSMAGWNEQYLQQQRRRQRRTYEARDEFGGNIVERKFQWQEVSNAHGHR